MAVVTLGGLWLGLLGMGFHHPLFLSHFFLHSQPHLGLQFLPCFFLIPGGVPQLPCLQLLVRRSRGLGFGFDFVLCVFGAAWWCRRKRSSRVPLLFLLVVGFLFVEIEFQGSNIVVVDAVLLEPDLLLLRPLRYLPYSRSRTQRFQLPMAVGLVRSLGGGALLQPVRHFALSFAFGPLLPFYVKKASEFPWSEVFSDWSFSLSFLFFQPPTEFRVQLAGPPYRYPRP